MEDFYDKVFFSEREKQREWNNGPAEKRKVLESFMKSWMMRKTFELLGESVRERSKDEGEIKEMTPSFMSKIEESDRKKFFPSLCMKTITSSVRATLSKDSENQ